MKKITKITTQQNVGRYNIFLDDEFYCGVTEDTLIKLELKKGKELDDDMLKELGEEENKNACFNYALFLLGRKGYFKKALIDKLKQKEYSEEAIDFTIDKLISLGYINDENLSRSYANDQKKFNKKGPKYIEYNLRAKGVDAETISRVMEESYNDDEGIENCTALIAKKIDGYRKKAKSNYELKGKLYAFLAGRGYKSDVIRKAIESFPLEDDSEEY